MSNEKTKASEEQMAYAGVLNIGMWFGLALLVVTFFVYISGLLPSFVPIDDLPKYWTMRVHDFNAALHAPTGWGWTAFIGNGDYLNFIPIAILAGLTLLRVLRGGLPLGECLGGLPAGRTTCSRLPLAPLVPDPGATAREPSRTVASRTGR